MADDGRPSLAFPGRPDHPDFRRLAALARSLDIRAEQSGFDFRRHLGQYLDSASIIYVAQQRALRIGDDADPLAQRVVAWIDGLVLGLEMARQGNAQVFDGQRRR